VRKVEFALNDGELRVIAPLATYRLRWRPEAKAEELLVARIAGRHAGRTSVC